MRRNDDTLVYALAVNGELTDAIQRAPNLGLRKATSRRFIIFPTQGRFAPSSSRTTCAVQEIAGRRFS
jgi:hypothetical protein